MKKAVFISSSILTLVSCVPDFGGELKKLDQKKQSNKDITINWYRTSSITTIHEHVEIIKGKNAKHIIEAAPLSIDQIILKNDSVIIKASGQSLFYNFDTLAFGYKIIKDTL